MNPLVSDLQRRKQAERKAVACCLELAEQRSVAPEVLQEAVRGLWSRIPELNVLKAQLRASAGSPVSHRLDCV